jgi:hypothetical protein
MSENPYKAPVSGLEAAATNTAGTLVDARTVDAGRGWEWIVEGFALFKKQPGMWILVLVVLLVCSIVISLVPVVGTLINMVIVQIFMGGLMLGCRALDGDGTLEISHLFAGFNQKTSDLVVLGVDRISRQRDCAAVNASQIRRPGLLIVRQPIHELGHAGLKVFRI